MRNRSEKVLLGRNLSRRVRLTNLPIVCQGIETELIIGSILQKSKHCELPCAPPLPESHRRQTACNSLSTNGEACETRRPRPARLDTSSSIFNSAYQPCPSEYSSSHNYRDKSGSTMSAPMLTKSAQVLSEAISHLETAL